MYYKTIILDLIQEYPALYEQLRNSKRLLPALDEYAIELKSSHDEWKNHLNRTRPGSHPIQITAEALELAIQDMTDRLRYASPADAEEPLSLDAAMSYVRSHSQTA